VGECDTPDWWGEAPERPKLLHNAPDSSRLIVRNAARCAEPRLGPSVYCVPQADPEPHQLSPSQRRVSMLARRGTNGSARISALHTISPDRPETPRKPLERSGASPHHQSGAYRRFAHSPFRRFADAGLRSARHMAYHRPGHALPRFSRYRLPLHGTGRGSVSRAAVEAAQSAGSSRKTAYSHFGTDCKHLRLRRLFRKPGLGHFSALPAFSARYRK
jgi:hypothetical protein